MNPGLDLNDLEVVYQVIPPYPLLAKRGGVQGDVVIRLTIDETGVPVRMELMEGPHALRDEAMQAVKLWRFGRKIFHGRKLMATMDVTFRFILR